MRLLLKLVLVLAVLAVGAFFVTTWVVNDRTRTAVERQTGEALGVEARLDRASVGILTGNFTLAHLDVANPEGFDAVNLLHMGSGGGQVRLATLMGEVAELPRVTLSNIEMSIERRAGTGNYEHVVRHIRQMERDPDDEGRRYIIRELVLRDVLVLIELAAEADETRRLEVPIAELRLTDVGTEGDRGVLLREAAGEVFKALLAAVLDQAGERLPEVLAEELAGRLGELGAISGVLEVAGERIGDVRDVLRGIGLGDLLPRRE